MSSVTSTVTISLPTTRVDGTPLPAGEVASVLVFQGPSAVSVTSQIANYSPVPATFDVTYDDSVDNFYAAKVFDTEGRPSVLGPVLTIPAVAVADPGAPSLTI